MQSRIGHRASPKRQQGEPAVNSTPCLGHGNRTPCLRCGLARKRNQCPRSKYIRGFHTPVFQPEKIAPDEDEASFKGTFKAEQKGFPFSLRVVKDKESGKWRVSYFQFKEQEEKK